MTKDGYIEKLDEVVDVATEWFFESMRERLEAIRSIIAIACNGLNGPDDITEDIERLLYLVHDRSGELIKDLEFLAGENVKSPAFEYACEMNNITEAE